MVQRVSNEISVNELIILKKYPSEIFFFFLWDCGSPIIKSVIFFVFEPVLKKEEEKKTVA